MRNSGLEDLVPVRLLRANEKTKHWLRSTLLVPLHLNGRITVINLVPHSSPFLPLRWWVGGWQQCTSTCGSDGVRKRTVLCVRTVSAEERVLHPVECKHLLKPKPVVPCNRDVPCGQDWVVGSWEEVRLLLSIQFFCIVFWAVFNSLSCHHVNFIVLVVPRHMWRGGSLA